MLYTALFLQGFLLAIVLVDNRDIHDLLAGVPHAYHVESYDSRTVAKINGTRQPGGAQSKSKANLTGPLPTSVKLDETSFSVGSRRAFSFGANPQSCLPKFHALDDLDEYEAESVNPYADLKLYETQQLANLFRLRFVKP